MGNPIICFPVPPDVYEELRRRAGEPTVGRAGGLALYLRRIVYEHLGIPLPVQYGDLGRSSKKRQPTGRKRGRPPKVRADQEAPQAGAVEEREREAT